MGRARSAGLAAARTRDPVLASRQHAAAIACAARPGNVRIGSKPASNKHQCKLVTKRDVIFWRKAPGQPATAQLLDDADNVTCPYSYSLADMTVVRVNLLMPEAFLSVLSERFTYWSDDVAHEPLLPVNA
jgi:hypothetical protein